MKTIFLALLTALAIYVGYVFYHTGAFKEVEFDFIEGPKFQMTYKLHVGPYHKITKSIEEVEKWLGERNVQCRQSFGLFLDDPKVVEEARLRSHVGCLVNARFEDPEQKIEFEEITAKKYLKAEFSGSPAIGPFKVYPKAEELMAEKNLKINGPVLEIYSLHSGTEMKTEYFFPIE